MIALVDCNNFYVSCERLFNPQWINRPVVVLSNNDGCIVARSTEAKNLGIPMGAPLFQWKDLIDREKVVVLSSNYTLYGDISHRIMQLLESCSSDLEVYSVDEAFLKVEMETPEEIRARILKWVGVPTSIGVAATKTLAKAASKMAKKEPSGVFYITEENRQKILAKMPVEEVWGIGRQVKAKLHAHGIFTVDELCQKNDTWIKKELSVVGLRTVWELRGVPALSLTQVEEKKKSIMCSRSFGSPLTLLEDVEEALSSYVAKAALRSRDQGTRVSSLEVFLHTNPHNDTPYYANRAQVTFPEPTHFTPDLISWAKKALGSIFIKGYTYKKVGVILMGLVDEEAYQHDLFTPVVASGPRDKLMNLMDGLNQKMGKETVKFAAEGIDPQWKMRNELKTQSFTTSWNDVLTIS